METVKEFLETSTIHGFAYLASTKSCLGKALWAVAILTAFFFAGFFIQRSYNSWEESPVDTTLSVHPISELDFPAITVCPSENTNTALNHAIMKTENLTLTDDRKKRLMKVVDEAFIDDPAKDFIANSQATVNTDNIRKLYFGTQSLPTIQKGNVYATNITGLNGSISTPYFGNRYDVNLYPNPGSLYLYTLELPKNLSSSVYDNGLDVEINFHTFSETGRTENLQYAGPDGEPLGDSSIYTLHLIKTTWDGAKDFCEEQGSFLAAVQSEKELKEVGQLVKQFSGSGFWLGGIYDPDEGNWTWVNGAAWNFSDWDTDHGFPSNELTKDRLVIYKGNGLKWRNYQKDISIEWLKPVGCICQTRTTRMAKSTRFQMKYKKEDLTTPIIRFWWLYDFSNTTYNVQEKNMTGMLIIWRMEKEEIQEGDNVLQVSFSPKTVAFRTTVNLLAKALSRNMTLGAIWRGVKAFKERMTDRAHYCEANPCSHGEMSTNDMMSTTMIKDFSRYLNLTAEEHMDEDMLEETINEGFKIFHYLIFCTPNMHKAVQFSKHLIANGKIGPLVQATVDVLLKDQSTFTKGFLTLLDSLNKDVDLDLMQLLATLIPTTLTLNTFVKNKAPFGNLSNEYVTSLHGKKDSNICCYFYIQLLNRNRCEANSSSTSHCL